MDARVLRTAAAAAIVGAAAHVVASALEPDWLGETAEAVRVVSESSLFIGDRALDLVSVLLTVGALTVVARILPAGPGREWARAGQPFLLLYGALWAGAVLTSAALKEVADAWTVAGPEARHAYLAAFDATASVADALFWGSFAATGVYLGMLGASILAGDTFARWIGWAALCSGALVLGGDLLLLMWEPGFLALYVGHMLFLAVLVALGVSLWRRGVSQAPSRTRAPAARRAGVLDGEAP